MIRPKPIEEDTVVGFVECATFEECRDYLQKHPEIITKEISEEMFEVIPIDDYYDDHPALLFGILLPLNRCIHYMEDPYTYSFHISALFLLIHTSFYR